MKPCQYDNCPCKQGLVSSETALAKLGESI